MTGLLVALAGGAGAVARFVLDGVITSRGVTRLPLATLAINVTGSFLLGLLTGWGGAVSPDVRHLVGVGLLGGFTTFSTASVELVRLVQAQRPRAAVALALLMLVASLVAAALGLAVA